MTWRQLIWIGCVLAAPSSAQPVQFSALLRGELGYGTNPFLESGVTGGAAFASVTISPRLSHETSRSSTILSGSYSRYKYFSRFGYTDALSANLERNDRLSEFLTSTLSAGYSTTNRATFVNAPGLIIDGTQAPVSGNPLDLGRRTRLFYGSAELQWQFSAADRFRIGGNAQRQTYGGDKGENPLVLASSYTQYAVNGGYDHTIDARTSAGLQVSVSKVQSHDYPDSRIIQTSLTIRRQLSAVWTVDAHAGPAFEKTSGLLEYSNTTLGYGADLCGTYPRTRVCISGERSTAPSGYGGLRTDSSISATVNHELDEHSRVSFAAIYYNTDADLLINLPAIGSSRALLLSADYDHDLTRRLSAGFGGNYQWRRTRRIGTARAVSANVHVSAKMGKL